MTLKENLARLRESKGLSQNKLAKIARISQQSISRLEAGIDLTSKHLPAIAQALGCSITDLDANYAIDGGTTVLSVPLISWVSAGKLTKPFVPIERLEDCDVIYTAGLDPHGAWVAFRVVNDSMDRISPPDSIIIVNLKERRAIPNACYVIADEDGGATYKRFRPSPDRWEPVSTNNEHQAIKPGTDKGPRIIGRVKRTILDL